MNPSLFICSSGESIFIAKRIATILNDSFRVKIWDAAMKPGEYFLEALSKELFFTDYGLFVIFPDDRIERRGNKEYTSRDNVIFELGMHVGALGIKRSYFLVVDVSKNGKELKLKIPTDLDGIKKTRLKLQLNPDNSLIENEANHDGFTRVCEIIKHNILEMEDGIALSLLPSTSLAIGYFKNFILQACLELSKTTHFLLGGESYDLTTDIFDFYIIIPDNGSKPSHEAYRNFVRKNNLNQIEIKSRSSPRTFPFFISTIIKDGRIQMYDLPTTLRASMETIKLVMPISTSKKDIEALEIKEIRNFKRTIQYLLQEPESMEFRDNIHIINASEIL